MNKAKKPNIQDQIYEELKEYYWKHVMTKQNKTVKLLIKAFHYWKFK